MGCWRFFDVLSPCNSNADEYSHAYTEREENDIRPHVETSPLHSQPLPANAIFNPTLSHQSRSSSQQARKSHFWFPGALAETPFHSCAVLNFTAVDTLSIVTMEEPTVDDSRKGVLPVMGILQVTADLQLMFRNVFHIWT